MIVYNLSTKRVETLIEIEGGSGGGGKVETLNYFQSTEPTNPQDGQTWFNTADSKIYTYKDGQWDEGKTPTIGTFYLYDNKYYTYNGTTLVESDLNIYQLKANISQDYTETSQEKYPSSKALSDAQKVNVRSVNGELPDNNGNVLITNVETANNLQSVDNINDAAYFVFRTAGGTKSISNGTATLLDLQGNIINPRRSLNDIDTTQSEAQRVYVSIDATVFGTAVSNVSGDYTFTFDGTDWSYNSNTVNLEDYGITLGATALNGDSFVVNYVYDNTGEEPIETATATYTEVNRLSIAVDESTFDTKVNGVVGSYNFLFNGNVWLINETIATLNEYGITITGTPIDGDSITVIYNGDMQVAYPIQFKAVGLNAFDKATNILSGYTINASGQIEASAGSYVAYIHAVGGLENAQAGTNRNGDYTIYSSNSAIVRVGYSATVPTTSSSVTLSGSDGIVVVDNGEDAATMLSYITFPTDGYICVATTDIDTLCVHPEWSGYEDKTYEEYSESVIDIPTSGTLDDQTVTLPTYLARIGIVADEISFERKEWINRIGYKTYSTANLEEIEQMGVDYVYDNNGIYYVLPSSNTYKLANTVTGQYTVADFGTEEFIYATGEPQVALLANTLYGNNLVDKLRTDVLTKSAQTLSDDQKEQVWKNIGALPLYNYPKTLVAGATVDVVLEDTKTMYELAPNQDTTLTFNVTNLTQKDNAWTTFYLFIDMTDAQQAYEITWPSSVQWGNTSPTMTAMVGYLFSFTKPKGSNVWIGNQMFSFVNETN